jgi:hypothetical protein
MSTDGFDDNPLEKSEELDSDEIRNDDGDEVVDAPERWIEAKDDETLDERLAEEEPDVTPSGDSGDDPEDSDGEPSEDANDSDQGGDMTVLGDVDLDRIDPERHGRGHGQIDGTPEDGESFFGIVK